MSFIKEQWQIYFRKCGYLRLIEFAVLLFDEETEIRNKFKVADLLAEEFRSRGYSIEKIKGPMPEKAHFFERYYLDGYKGHDPEDEIQDFIDRANDVIKIKVGMN